MKNSTVIPLSEVAVGDFLTGLDNGYVVEIEVTSSPDSYGPEDFVTVTFHTADGREAYLSAPNDVPVHVNTPRETP